MINGVHALVYAKDAEKVRAFFRDILGLSSVDAGGWWLISALPPAELGIHPADGAEHDKFDLMCDDIAATVTELKSEGVEITRPIADVQWGLVTAIKIPGGAELAVYQSKHPTALGLNR